MKKDSPYKSTKKTTSTNDQAEKCKVCGDEAIHVYFGVTSCEPCKMFFKRNAEQKQELLQCKSNGDCTVNIYNRHICSYCRLMKCFQSGMQVERIRAVRLRANKKRRQKKLEVDQVQNAIRTLTTLNEHEQYPTLNLLEADHSILSIDQWNLIINLSHCFDHHNGLEIGERYIRAQIALPPKLRFKSLSFIEYIQSLLNIISSVYQNNQDFRSLSSHNRSILLHITSKPVGILIANFIHHHIGLSSYRCFYDTIELISHPSIVFATKRIQTRLNFDLITMKLFLVILTFSTTNHTSYSTRTPLDFSNIKEVLHIQNTYVELLWRYLMYKYNFKEAVICFTDLIQCLFTIHDILVQTDNIQWFIDKTDSIVKQIQEVLVLND